MDVTPRLGLPFISAGQAQKELFHNESLQTLDLLVCACVEEPPRADPPSSPGIGQAYILSPVPTGDWTGKSRFLAAFTSGGWRFVAPYEGVTVFVKSESVSARFHAGEWEVGQIRGSTLLIGGQQVVGARTAAIASAAGGASVDSEARAVIDQILAAMRQHGLIES